MPYAKYRHERGMGSRSKHGWKVERWDNRRTIKENARALRAQKQIVLRRMVRELFEKEEQEESEGIDF